MIIVDGNLLAHRAFHKLDFLANSAGVHTGMEFGFLRSVESLQNKIGEKIVICFDTKYNKKKKEGSAYKANRTVMKDEFYDRLKNLQKFLLNFWDLAWQPGEEADDVMYSIASKTDEEVYLYSNDNDLLQCVNDRISVLKSHDSSLYIWDAAKVEEKFGVPPELLVLFRSFVGDKTDNLEGVPRIQKRILADAIQYWVHTPNEIFKYSSWSISMAGKIEEFIRSGQWQENYDLMKLEVCDYQYFEKELDEGMVVNMLKTWEIGSLNLCEPYKKDLVNSESEF